MNTVQEKWLNINVIAEYLDLKHSTIRTWFKRNTIPAHKIGKQWIFKISEVDEWITSGKSVIK